MNRGHTPDSTAAAKRSRRSSITESADFSIGRFSFEQPEFSYSGELRQNLEKHASLIARQSHIDLEVETKEVEDANDAEGDDDSVYPAPAAMILIMIAICLAVFCMCLDMTIISTAIPRITDDFRALDDVGWYASSYMLTLSAFQLFYGKLYTFFSVKWIFLMAISWFEIGKWSDNASFILRVLTMAPMQGSAICGAAPNSTGTTAM